MSAIDWRDLFESVSLVDEMLRAKSDFAEFDFATRDLYRRAIEELARGSSHPEIEIARRALCAARHAGDAAQNEDESTSARRHDPGYYLIAKGRPAFEKAIGFHPSIKEWLARTNAAVGISGYLGVIVFITAIIAALMVSWVTGPGESWPIAVIALLALIPASNAAMALVNFGALNRFHANILPSLELADGVPSSLRTMIVMPTLLTSGVAIAEQVERLEIHHLANSDGDLCFALLSDWTDSITESAAGDDELLRAAAEAIAGLNRHYGTAPDGDRFLLLQRRRLWNEGQGMWIGWERKRGKLHEFNRLLRGATDTTFVSIDGRPPIVPDGVRYVIALDADTQLPRGTAKRLIGKMAHPLNRPTLDPLSGRVIDGYAILQPRVTPSLPTGREGSLFQRVFSSTTGMDPYAGAVSDLYQDLFGEGSYCGKGIYDVDLFEAALAGRIPENTLLSHDLLEGIFARAGLASDIEVIDEFPARYDVAIARQHRWTRGDWQLLPWICGWGQTSNGDRRLRAIPLIGRWKMIDNLRRSLSAPASFLALVAGWTLPIVSAELWSAFILTTVAIPALLPFLTGVVPRRVGLSKRIHLRVVGADIKLALSQIVLLVTFLAHLAWVMSDAVLRTLFRLIVSRRNLLEWVTAAQTKVSPRLDLVGFCRQMAGGVALAVGSTALVAWVAPNSWAVAAPFLFLWLLSPAIARWTSLPTPASIFFPASATDRQALRMIARRTWLFFETFVTAEDHMLPPDNFQEDPAPVIAHRTSPTNLGLYLLSVVAARDFGWIGTLETVERLEATLQSMHGVERFRGHFYNWYGTLDLRPLDPKYVSTVDSGNLAGHLIALWNACDEMAKRPLMDPRWLAGIGDALDLMRASLRGGADDRGSHSRKQLDEALDTLAASLRQTPSFPVGIAGRLRQLALHAKNVADIARTLTEDRHANTSAETVTWANAICASVLSHQRDLESFMPWTGLIAVDAGCFTPASVIANTCSEYDLVPLFAAVPTLVDLPALCNVACTVLKRRQAELVALPNSGGNAHLKLNALIDSFNHSALAAATFEGRLAALGELARKMFHAMAFNFLFDPDRELLSIGYRGRRWESRPQLLRSDRLRGASCELHSDRQGRRADAPLVSAWTCPGARWIRFRADLMVRLDVRVPDAIAGNARAGRKSARADELPDCATAGEVRRPAGCAVGRFRIRIQCARHGTHLSIFQLWHSGLGL